MTAMASLEDTCTAANPWTVIGRQNSDGSLSRSGWLDDYLDPGPDLAHAGRNLGPSVTGQQPGPGVVCVSCWILVTQADRSLVVVPSHAQEPVREPRPHLAENQCLRARIANSV